MWSWRFLWIHWKIIDEVFNYPTSSVISSKLNFICIILYRQCVCNPEPPQPPAPSICKNGATCRSDIDCGDGGYCDYIHPPSSSIPPSIRGMMYLTSDAQNLPLINHHFTILSSHFFGIYIHIYQKTEIQTVILRCWTFLYLHWFYS